MKKTKAQRDYHQEMAQLNRESEGKKAPYKRPRYSFRESKFYYYAIRIMIILIVLWFVSIFDSAFYNIINFYR